MIMLPAAVPNLRATPLLSAHQRLHLLQLALKDVDDVIIDARELARDGVSYTVDSISELTAEKATDEALVLIMGSDAFLKFHLWKDWQRILQQAHLVVMHRPGWVIKQNELAVELTEIMTQRECKSVELLQQSDAGLIRFEQVTPYDISATAIRHALAAGETIKTLVPAAVNDYITRHGLY
jgi:nicotinate-nucleotide adenylyltransferase